MLLASRDRGVLSEGCVTVVPVWHAAFPLCEDGSRGLKRLSTSYSSLLGPREFNSTRKQPVPCVFPILLLDYDLCRLDAQMWGLGAMPKGMRRKNRMSSKHLSGKVLFTLALLETETYGSLVLTHLKDDRGTET